MESERRAHLGDALAVDVETLEHPVAGLDGVDAAVGDDVVELLHDGDDVEGVDARGLG